VAPSRRYADVIIPWQRGDNLVAIDLITEHIRTKLQQSPLRRIYPNLEVIQSNYQVCVGGGVNRLGDDWLGDMVCPWSVSPGLVPIRMAWHAHHSSHTSCVLPPGSLIFPASPAHRRGRRRIDCCSCSCSCFP
jgi:hypothetical protein